MKHIQDAIKLVLSGQASINAASKAADVSTQTLRKHLYKHPDYAKAVAEGRIAAPPDTTAPDVNALRTNPAVLAVVNDGLSLRKAIELYPDNGTTSAATLGNWVKKAFPDHVIGSPTGGRRRSTEELVAPDIDALADEVIARAKALNLDPAKLAKWVLKQVEDRPAVYVEVESQSGERRARAEMSARALRDSRDPAGLVLQALAAADKAVNAPD